MQKTYHPEKIEPIIQRHWEKKKTFFSKKDVNREKYYCLSMLPYPSGNLHIGHVRNYTIGDVISRYQRLLGKNVLQPIGWDAFGLPAENAAIKHNIPPSIWTYSNICYMKKQLKSLGFAYDWSRELITCQPEYYLWEQWFFTVLYQKGLIYKKTSWVNWCQQDQTVLANEQVVNDCCWRCNTKIQYKKIPQWFIKITKYAEQLLQGLNKLKDWPEEVKFMQKNWIGRSKGIEISFKIIDHTNTVTIYTTRSDTIMGVTYLAIATNHPLSIQISENDFNINNYLKENQTWNKKNRSNSLIKLTGIATNIYALHPLTNEKLPIWINSAVSEDYGTGAIMGVPAHNQEDWKFAHQYNLPIKPVILDEKNQKPNLDIQAMTYKGNLFNSGEFNHLNHQKAIQKITDKLINLGIAKRKIHYRIQDWNISRQRYWGTPIPMMILKNGNTVPVPIEQLPVILPENISPNHASVNPLKNSDWIHTTYKNIPALRETDTFDTFIESSWYYARYTCPNYKYGMLFPEYANYWLPIDQYVGGIEHATMHLIYFRFYHKLMRDFGLVNSDEPAIRLLCQGMVLSDAFYYLNENNKQIWVPLKNITNIKRDKKGNILQAIDLDGNDLFHFGMVKMSKSKKNGVDPSIIIKKYGADTLRLFIMFAAPANAPLEWKESGVIGSYRFLKRLWRLVYEHVQDGPTEILNINLLNYNQKILRKRIHQTISKVTDDINRRQTFNTAIASIMKLVNYVILFSWKKDKQDRALLHEALSSIIRMLYPFTPHITFVLWKALGEKEEIDNTHWPLEDKSALIEDMKIYLIQINGKVRHKITVPNDIDQNKLLQLLLKEDSLIFKYLKNKKIINTIYIPNKLMNLIVK